MFAALLEVLQPWKQLTSGDIIPSLVDAGKLEDGWVPSAGKPEDLGWGALNVCTIFRPQCPDAWSGGWVLAAEMSML